MKTALMLSASAIILFFTSSGIALEAPVLTATTSGTSASLSWTQVAGAQGYLLHVVPYPFTGMDSIQTFPVGNILGLQDVPLWDGAEYYIAVSASAGSQAGAYSNVELISISGNSGSKSYLTASDLVFPVSGNDWIFSTYRGHDSIGKPSTTIMFKDTYAYDLNREGDLDAGMPVTAIADGRTVLSDPKHGFVVVEHTTPLMLDDGRILDVWYSKSTHMKNLIPVNVDVTPSTVLGNVSNTKYFPSGNGNMAIHLHFVIYELSFGIYTSIDAPNLLKDFNSSIAEWQDWCSVTSQDKAAWLQGTYDEPWWKPEKLPCGYIFGI